MHNILIISSTKNSNYELSLNIKGFFDDIKNVNVNVISLEDFDLPLYTPTLEEKFKETKSFPDSIEKVKNMLKNSQANVKNQYVIVLDRWKNIIQFIFYWI